MDIFSGSSLIESVKVFDFNVALELIYNKYNAEGRISELSNMKSDVEKKMRSLNNPYDEYKEAFESAFALYGNIMKFTDLAQSPSGSLASYNLESNKISEEVQKIVQEFKIRIPLEN